MKEKKEKSRKKFSAKKPAIFSENAPLGMKIRLHEHSG